MLTDARIMAIVPTTARGEPQGPTRARASRGRRLPARRLSRRVYIYLPLPREPLRRSRARSTALCGAELVELERDTNPP